MSSPWRRFRRDPWAVGFTLSVVLVLVVSFVGAGISAAR